MNTFAVLFLCIQGFLVQNVFSQCTSRAAVEAPGFAAPYSWAPSPLTAPFAPGAASLATAAPYGYRTGYPDIAYPAAGFAPYGGAGEGNVAVAGELPVAGSTAVTGQVPIMGAVNFGGVIPAAGAVTITGQCACGCGAPYGY